jgi:hypothetical protein
MEQLWQDLKYAVRVFIEKPALLFAAVFILVVGVEASRGRFIADGEDQPGKNHVAVLSDRTWRNSFGSRLPL